MQRTILAVALIVAAGMPAVTSAQIPLSTYADAFETHAERSQPVVSYVVHANPPHDSLGYSVEMHVRNAPDTLRLAIPFWAPGAYRPAHFERYIRNVDVTTGGTHARPIREDSSTWRAAVRGGEATISYEVRYPSAPAAAGLNNYSFYRSDGALLSGPMTYIYLVGHKLVAAHVAFDLPEGWKIATGLAPTSNPRSFFAPSYDVLIDCPTLIGADLHIWPFDVAGVPHRVAYYTQRGAPPVDSVRWVAMHARVVSVARDIMGALPYREYTHIYEDGPGGGLEHLNSSTMSAQARRVAANPFSTLGLTSHEYFHAWNVKRARPVELGPFDYAHEVHTTGLWWAEGMTDFFANEIQRRTGLRPDSMARHDLEATIGAYLSNPGHDKISPERASWTAWNANTVNGGYNVSYYTTGSLIGELFELRLRDATDGARGMDDVERFVFDHYAGVTGYTDQNLLDAVNTVCGCDLDSFFTRYIAGHESFDFDGDLARAGWRVELKRIATDSAGAPLADTRGRIAPFAGVGSLGSYVGAAPRLTLSTPDGSFARAGLEDGDYIVSVQGKPIHTAEEFTAAFAGARVGSKFTVAYTRADKPGVANVTIQPYETVQAHIVDLPNISERQLRIREIWLHGPRR